MKSVLEQSGYYTDSLKQQVEYAGSLADKYDILKKRFVEELLRKGKLMEADNEINAHDSKGCRIILFDIDSNMIEAWRKEFDGVEGVQILHTSFEEIENARIQMQEDLIAEGIMEESQRYTTKVIEQFLYSSGFEKVKVE